MPAYNFKKEFVPRILDGSKPHTIRGRRKRPTRVGDVLYLFTGLRTKQCRMFAISECVKVERIAIYPDSQMIGVNYAWLNYIQISELAVRDGFANARDFFKFFEDHYDLPMSDFEIIWWSVDLLMPVNGNRKGGEYRMRLGAK